ncbi:hypothetical protein NPIL_125121, partial [Nephila pilipes]
QTPVEADEADSQLIDGHETEETKNGDEIFSYYFQTYCDNINDINFDD